MKKAFLVIAIASCFVACSGGENKADNNTPTEIGGVENVNGNIPDTNSMGATPQGDNSAGHVDSSYADTAGKKANR